ncbi:helix-turn-helix domain-containing protein [Cytophagaceae bacterium DM2B3-1]|uniref:Helix-turn-helix domain-containing protein n=1 Tax=Xanthocytophaga flava TaxID=3048013 RepID=A0ABT7CUD6_9BACT|nr:helix-turn-helix domain-containing protein [Xanthocytophaga flavus]MDJ1469071.1 helix-turn-helix domain-containing protein [Xanthocytophaga flavus]MDJ1497383.1 helix-turn-helix domain-containing protein [Xanthocytophaga flavus]
MFNPFEELQLRLIRLEALIVELQSVTIPVAPADKQLGGIELAMQITGLAQSTIYNLVCAGSIPHMKRGRKLYFSKPELEAWILAGKQKTLQELEEEIKRHLSDNGNPEEPDQATGNSSAIQNS